MNMEQRLADVLELLCIDLTQGYNTMPRSVIRRDYVESALYLLLERRLAKDRASAELAGAA